MIAAEEYVKGTRRIYLAHEQGGYGCFIPPKINKEFVLSNRVSQLSEEAMRLVGELNAYSTFVPDADFFISMHVRREAVQSSKIEGTYTDIDDAILAEEDVRPERRDDWREVQNYIRALDYSKERLKSLPLSIRLLNEAHAVLLEHTRGDGKSPGELRTKQNWIGGASLATALFIPPHNDYLPELLTDLEQYLHNTKLAVPKLVKIAVTHYQFETIHPYADGNGRIGRLLITLQLINEGVLTKPTLYLSDFFEKNRSAYYGALTEVRERQNLDHWLTFFLEGVIESAKSSKEKFIKIMELRDSYAQGILSLGRRAKNANRLIMALYSHPVTEVSDVCGILSLTPPNANRLVADLVGLGILKEVTGFTRNRIFVLDEYVKIFRS